MSKGWTQSSNYNVVPTGNNTGLGSLPLDDLSIGDTTTGLSALNTGSCPPNSSGVRDCVWMMYGLPTSGPPGILSSVSFVLKDEPTRGNPSFPSIPRPETRVCYKQISVWMQNSATNSDPLTLLVETPAGALTDGSEMMQATTASSVSHPGLELIIEKTGDYLFGRLEYNGDQDLTLAGISHRKLCVKFGARCEWVTGNHPTNYVLGWRLWGYDYRIDAYIPPDPGDPPETPIGLGGLGVCENSRNTLTWLPSEGADGYILYRDGVEIYDGVEPSFIDEDVEIGVEYSYTVSAYNEDGESPQSAAVLITPCAVYVPPAPVGRNCVISDGTPPNKTCVISTGIPPSRTDLIF